MGYLLGFTTPIGKYITLQERKDILKHTSQCRTAVETCDSTFGEDLVE